MTHEPPPGEIFAIPLLGGGFAFGYITLSRSGVAYCDVFDYVGESQIPPTRLADRPVLLRDQTAGAEFDLPRSSKVGERWTSCGIDVGRPVRPQDRYVRMGIPPRRVDLLGEEPDAPIPADQVPRYRLLAVKGPPHAAAVIEVSVKRLASTPEELIARWRAGELTAPLARPGARKKKSNKKSTASDTVHVQIALGHPGFPSASELARRHALEDLIAQRSLGEVVDAGAGGGFMDVFVRMTAPDASVGIRKLLAEAGLAEGDVTVEALTT